MKKKIQKKSFISDYGSVGIKIPVKQPINDKSLQKK